jgi:hypothetical protein
MRCLPYGLMCHKKFTVQGSSQIWHDLVQCCCNAKLHLIEINFEDSKLGKTKPKNARSCVIMTQKKVVIGYIQGVSKIRVLILTRGRACQIKRFFYLNFLRKSVRN